MLARICRASGTSLVAGVGTVREDMDIWVVKSLKDPSALGSKMLWNLWIFQAVVELITHVLPLLMPPRGYDAISVLETELLSLPR